MDKTGLLTSTDVCPGPCEGRVQAKGRLGERAYGQHLIRDPRGPNTVGLLSVKRAEKCPNTGKIPGTLAEVRSWLHDRKLTVDEAVLLREPSTGA